MNLIHVSLAKKQIHIKCLETTNTIQTQAEQCAPMIWIDLLSACLSLSPRRLQEQHPTGQQTCTAHAAHCSRVNPGIGP